MGRSWLNKHISTKMSALILSFSIIAAVFLFPFVSQNPGTTSYAGFLEYSNDQGRTVCTVDIPGRLISDGYCQASNLRCLGIRNKSAKCKSREICCSKPRQPIVRRCLANGQQGICLTVCKGGGVSYRSINCPTSGTRCCVPKR